MFRSKILIFCYVTRKVPETQNVFQDAAFSCCTEYRLGTAAGSPEASVRVPATSCAEYTCQSCSLLSLSRPGLYIALPKSNLAKPDLHLHNVNPRTAGGLSHLRTAGGGRMTAPPENSKTKKDRDKR